MMKNIFIFSVVFWYQPLFYKIVVSYFPILSIFSWHKNTYFSRGLK